jgi:hypothetical protein
MFGVSGVFASSHVLSLSALNEKSCFSSSEMSQNYEKRKISGAPKKEEGCHVLLQSHLPSQSQREAHPELLQSSQQSEPLTCRDVLKEKRLG